MTKLHEHEEFYVHVTVHPNKFLVNKTNRRTNFPNLFVKKLHMFQTVPLPIIRSFPPYMWHRYMTCRFDDTYQCQMYGGKFLMMGRGTARNM